jgi:hypothetical protein
VLLIDQLTKEAQDVITLHGDGERMMQMVSVVGGDGFDLRLVRLLSARDDTLTDESISSGEASGHDESR